VRRSYEQKSSGAAAVLSTVCPGLGQVYNGQIGKGAGFFLIVLTGLCVLSWGVMLMVKMPGGSSVTIAAAAVSRPEPVEMNEEGIVAEEAEEMAKEEAAPPEQPKAEEPSKEEKRARNGLVFAGAGALLMIGGAYFAVRDAIRTAKRLNAA